MKRARRKRTRRAGRRAATALGMASVLGGAAQATPLHETTSFDLGDTFATRTVTLPGTDVVQGSVGLEGAFEFDLDFFAFADLVPGSSFSITLETFITDGSVTLFRLFDESQVPLSPFVGVPDFTQQVITGTVPASGELVVWTQAGQDIASYQVTLVADRVAVPEPSTALLAGAGLAAVSYLRRRRAA